MLIHNVDSTKEIAIFNDAIKGILCAFGAIYIGTADGFTYKFTEQGDLL